jgi:predicted nucleotidyltransferase
LTRRSESTSKKQINSWLKKYPFTLRELKNIYKRKWNYGFYEGKAFSVHVVNDRFEEKYGDKLFYPLKIVRGRAQITDITNSLFLPCIYEMTFFNPLLTGIQVDQLVSYDSFYAGLFEVGDNILIKGKLEKVVDQPSRRVYYRIVVGSLEAHGEDYIKPIL